MITQLFKKKKELEFERAYPAPAQTVWQAWTRPEMLREWWGPEKTAVAECEIDLQVGGRIYVVTEAGEAMGKYQGTRWPMDGTFTLIEEHTRLSYDARSWTEGEEEGTTIHHLNDLSLSEADGTTTIRLHVTITEIGPKAKLAAFGMKWGYKQQLDHLGDLLARGS
jgi:uncharacterized protein YndB with AHSA1/START domain